MVTFNLWLPWSLWKNTEQIHSCKGFRTRPWKWPLSPALFIPLIRIGHVTANQLCGTLRNVILNSQEALKELLSIWLVFVTIKIFSWFFFFSQKDLGYTMRIQMRKHDNITLEWGQLENESEIFCAKHLCFMILKPFPYISCNHDCYSFPHCDSSEFIH